MFREICTFTTIEGNLKLKHKQNLLNLEENQFIKYDEKMMEDHLQYDFCTKHVSRNLHMIRFDYTGERRQNMSSDILQPMTCGTAHCKMIYSSANLTVDEQLLTFRGRRPFREYIP